MATMIHTLTDCLAPAKLNLFLHVTGRRPDGYHLLQAVFQLIDYGDTLHFSTREDNLLHRATDIPGVPEHTDLIIRAAHLLQSAARDKGDHRPLGADISIDKRLPMGGGLGGGSSDAATTLIALNHLWQTGFNRQELMSMGLQLGADVPFFVFGQNAFAEGVGEALQTVNTPSYWYVVIHPAVSIPTAAIFSSPELTRNSKPVRIADFPEAAIGFGKNDLQAVATKLFPPVEQAIKWLSSYGEARMTGSGSCVFCPFKEEHDADEVLKQARQSGQGNWSVWKARAIERHPLSHLVGS